MKTQFTENALGLWASAEHKASQMGQGYVGPEHVILAFLESKNDLANLVINDYIGTIDKLNEKVTAMGRNWENTPETTENLLKLAHREANITFSSQIDVPHLIAAAFNDNNGQENLPKKIFQEFGISVDWFLKLIRHPKNIKQDIAKITMMTNAAMPVTKGAGSVMGAKSVLEKYGRELTVLAENHKLDPVALREKEIDDIIEILSRRVKSNPLLVGEPGVGKSALLSGLAQRIVSGNVPDKIKGARIFELNLTLVIAGASVQGEFEKRMNTIINYVKQENIILFIDEIHTIVGTGGGAGVGDAASILKTPLINGDIKCIGSTTIKEYRKHIERDPALARRFQTIEISEPTREETVDIINSVKHLYEQFHSVILPEKVIRKTVELAVLHIKDHYLPDKAIDLIDQACAHVSLKKQAGENREVTIEDVAVIISHKTKIPLEKLTSDKLDKLLHLEDLLRKRIVGQDEAIDKVGDIIRLTKSSLDLKPVRPDGVFLFIGPTGVGKTELARVLAEILFDDESKMIRLDMSEYMEPHSVSKIIGSPPGYIGSDQEGGLTGRVRTEPYSIILLDEVEKAHPDVLNIFLQVFEDGRMTDSQGRTAYFSNCTIIMTSNVGATKAFTKKREIGFNESNEIDFKGTEKLIRESIRKHFTPEFINRVDEIIYFKPLDKNAIRKIAEIKLSEIEARFARENKKIKISDSVLNLISMKGYNPEYGARYLNRTIEDLVLKPLSKTILANPDQNRFLVKLNKQENVNITGRVK